MAEEFAGVGEAFFNLIKAFLNVLVTHWVVTLIVIFVFIFFATRIKRH